MRRRWGLIITGGLALVTAGTAWGLWRMMVGRHSLAEELAAARKEGLPVDAQDLIEPLPPDAENGAIPYLQAAAMNRRLRETTAWRRKLGDVLVEKGPSDKPRPLASLSQVERRRLKRLLAVQEPAFAALKDAVKRPRFVLNRAWHHSYPLDIDDIRMFGFVVDDLILRARVRQLEEDGPGAYHDLAQAARASALFQHGTVPYEFETRHQLEERILNQAIRWRLAPEQLRALVEHLGPPPDFHRNYRAQIFMTRRKFAHENATEASSMRLRSVYEATEALYIAYRRTLARRLPKDPLAFDAIHAAASRTNHEFDRQRDSWDIIGIPLDLDNFEIDAFARNEALRRMTLAVADVLEFRHRKHRWPDALPKAYADPFGGKLRYHRKGEGFTVYSVGENGQDDGGDLGTSTKSSPDFVVTVSPPSPKGVRPLASAGQIPLD